MKLLRDDDLATLESHLRRVLARTFAPTETPSEEGWTAGVSPMRDAIAAYVLQGGKRLRPQLCLWTWRCIVGSGQWAMGTDEAQGRASSLPTSLLDLACGWELFHAFLLVHDDIIDGADRRRDRPSLHRHLQSLDSDSARFGMNLGIVAGDLLFSAAMRLWHEVDLPDAQYRPALRLFSRIASTTGFGQAIDIVQGHVPIDEVREATLLREYHWKTAAYTFEGPMLTAAVLAGLGEGACAAIGRYALALGQAYQLQNDLADLLAPSHEGCDLVQGKRTVTLVRARAAMSGADRQMLDGRLDALGLATGREGVRLAESLRRDLLSAGAAGRTQALIEDFLGAAETAAADGELPDGLSTGLSGLLDALRQGYFAVTAGPFASGQVPVS